MTEVAKWGFISSLMLNDFDLQNREYFKEIDELQQAVAISKKRRIPFGLDQQHEALAKLEKRHRIIEKQREEFLNLSNKIYEMIKQNGKSDIYESLDQLLSLPHSFGNTHGVLEVSDLGVFSRNEEVLDVLRSDLN